MGHAIVLSIAILIVGINQEQGSHSKRVRVWQRALLPSNSSRLDDRLAVRLLHRKPRFPRDHVNGTGDNRGALGSVDDKRPRMTSPPPTPHSLWTSSSVQQPTKQVVSTHQEPLRQPLCFPWRDLSVNCFHPVQSLLVIVPEGLHSHRVREYRTNTTMGQPNPLHHHRHHCLSEQRTRSMH